MIIHGKHPSYQQGSKRRDSERDRNMLKECFKIQ